MSRKLPFPQQLVHKTSQIGRVCTRKSTKIQFPKKSKRVATFICQKTALCYTYAKNSELKKFCFTIFYEVDAAMHQTICDVLFYSRLFAYHLAGVDKKRQK